MARNPNQGGTGPHTSKQGKRGPITTNWTLTKGSSKAKGTSSSQVSVSKPGPSPSKSKGGWFLGSKSKGPASHNPSPGR